MLNVVICGTPGTGKSSLVDRLKVELKDERFNYINIGDFAKENNCTSGWDEDFNCHVIEEDKLAEILEPELKAASSRYIIESIHPDYIDPELIGFIFVCRTDNTILYDRLEARGYNKLKIEHNLEAEIFQTILDEAKNCDIPPSNIVELTNNEPGDLDRNLELVMGKICQSLAQSNATPTSES